MGVGSYNYEDSKEYEFNEGKVITEFSLDVEYLEDVRMGELELSNFFQISVTVNLKHEGNIENVGIEVLNYSIFLNDERTIYLSETLNLEGAESYKKSIIRQLNQGSRVILTGFVQYNFYVNGELHTEKTELNLEHIQPVDSGYYLYSVDLPLIWLNLLYFVILGILVIALGRVIWNIRFSLRYTDEEREKDEYYHSFIRKLGQEKKAESIS